MDKECSVIQSAHGEEYAAAQEAWDFQQAKIDELQARVDEVIARCKFLKTNGGDRRNLEDIELILKGNKDEN